MSVTIVPDKDPLYWFVDVGDSVISGVTDPGLVTTTKFNIEYNKDWALLVSKLAEVKHKLSPALDGFRIVDDKLVFFRDGQKAPSPSLDISAP